MFDLKVLTIVIFAFTSFSTAFVPEANIHHRALGSQFQSQDVPSKSRKGHLLGFLFADFRQNVSTRFKAFGRKTLVYVLSDETMSTLEGDYRYDSCDVIIQCINNVNVDQIIHLILSYKNHNLPQWFVLHVGSNDIVPEVPMTAAIVIAKLKKLLQTISFTWKSHSTKMKTHVILSSIFPQLNAHPNYNVAVQRINKDMLLFSERIKIPYINNDLDFWPDGALVENLLADGPSTLSAEGAKVVKARLIDDIGCSENGHSNDFNKKEKKLELKDVLPENPLYYDKYVPPKSGNGPTIVYFHVTVLTIDTIDEESMTYVTDIFLAQTWHDYRLRLPKNMKDQYRILDINWLKNIWTPDTFVKNAKKVTFHEMSVPNHYLWIHHNKDILYMAKMSLVLSCPMTFKNYPHDTQVCSMLIESLSHKTDDLVFRWNLTYPLVVSPEIELPQLDVIESTTKDCNFTCLSVVFTLRRRLGYHLFHTYIPTGLIVVMSWISFWISPEAVPARVTLAVTSLLTLATQNTQSQASLPPVSYVKAIDVWMSSCTVFVFCSLMEYAMVTYFMRYRNKFTQSEVDLVETTELSTGKRKV
ncbi:Glycine receptor subunit alpha-2 [Nymphon striatum]|nr:Glycine receptor subunit alpha-2 [Nymphon striatum]